MPDITLCSNYEKCPLKETCKRSPHHYPPGIYQSYAEFEIEECKYYWEIKKDPSR